MKTKKQIKKRIKDINGDILRVECDLKFEYAENANRLNNENCNLLNEKKTLEWVLED